MTYFTLHSSKESLIDQATYEVWIPKDAPIFSVHFPQNQLLPGAFIIGMMFDILQYRGVTFEKTLHLKQITFRHACRPNSLLEIEIEETPEHISFTARNKLDQKLLFDGQIVVSRKNKLQTNLEIFSDLFRTDKFDYHNYLNICGVIEGSDAVEDKFEAWLDHKVCKIFRKSTNDQISIRLVMIVEAISQISSRVARLVDGKSQNFLPIKFLDLKIYISHLVSELYFKPVLISATLTNANRIVKSVCAAHANDIQLASGKVHLTRFHQQL